jgi:hypothetical protein
MIEADESEFFASGRKCTWKILPLVPLNPLFLNRGFNYN